MKLRPAWSLKRYLYALIAVIALPLAGVVAYLWTAAVAENRTVAADQLRQAADHIAADLRRLHRQHAWILSQVAASPAIRDLDQDGCKQEARMLRRLHPEVLNVILWDRSGVLVCGAGDIPDPGGVINNRSLLAKALAADGMVVSDVIWGRRGGRHLVLFMHPVTDARGDKAAVLTMGINLDYFDQLLAGLRLPGNSAAGVLDQEGQFLSRVPEGAAWRGRSIRDLPLAEFVTTPDRAAIEAKGVDETTRLYVGYPVPETSWNVFVGMPSDLLLAPHRKWLVTSALLTLCILALSALAAYMVGLRINRPLDALARAADRIARGDLQARAPQDGFAESAHVARQFNQMAEELERSHDRLRENATRLDGVIAGAMDGIVIMNHEGIVLGFNPAAERIFGYSRETAIGRNVAELIIPQRFREAHHQGMARYLATGESSILGRRVEIEAMRADGTTFPVELSITRIGHGTPPVFTGFIRDIAERKRAETALRESRQLLDKTFESMDQAVFVVDMVNRTVIACNPATAKVFGYRADELVGKGTELLHVDGASYQEFGKRVLVDLDGIGVFRTEYRMRRRDGSVFPTEHTVTELRDDAGQRIGAVSVVTDITERKRAEAALRDYAERMRRLSQRLSEIEENERRNINRELHDRVGQNLSILNLSLSRLRAQPERPADWRETLDDAQAMAQSTIALIRNIMADLRPPALDDFGLLAALRNHVDAYAARTGLAVEVNGDAIAPRLPLATETALFRIAQEALTNVAKHANAKRVEITLQQLADRIRLTITDDGVGFEAGETRSPRASWGLGGMRERAEAIGAILNIESGRRKGTRVTVEIPHGIAA